jgi:hypothetical protein
MMKVEVVTPEEYMGDVIGDLNSRRGQINNMEDRGNAKVVTAWCRWQRCSVTSIPALDVARPRAIHDAIRPLRRCSGERGRRS